MTVKDYYEVIRDIEKMDYCPHCGAKMNENEAVYD